MIDALRHYITEFSKDKEKSPVLQGLLNNLCTFDVEIPGQEDHLGRIHPLLAVANNIITRGLPTLASERVEAAFENTLGFTAAVIDKGTITYPAQNPGDKTFWNK